jgi:hypothetical protein
MRPRNILKVFNHRPFNLVCQPPQTADFGGWLCDAARRTLASG